MIPLPLYTPIYFNFLLLIVLVSTIRLVSDNEILSVISKSDLSALTLFSFVILYLGLRPISGYYFGDMLTYANYFINYAEGGEIESSRDWLWHKYMQISSRYISVTMFFLLTSFLYTYPLYKASSNWVQSNKYYLLLAFIISFSFWAYGTNGLRNGVATSIFILGLSYYYNRKLLAYTLLLTSYFIHGSMIIPLLALLVTFFVKDHKYFFLGWLAAIPLSLLLGSFWENLIISIGFGDERMYYLTDTTYADSFSSIGFRWDFLLYSSSAVYAGYYFVVKRGFRDMIYNQILNIYLATNTLWVLVIRASFSNRVAYLSWFLMAVVIFYPLLKQKFFDNQQQRLAYLLLGYFAFTYLMNFVLPNL